MSVASLYRHQIQAFRQFETVVDHIIGWGSNSAIWRWRKWFKKKLMVELEQSAEVHRLALALASRQSPDLETWESLMLQAVPQGGRTCCRTVVSERLKQSGMHWSVCGANAILALRCCILSGRFEDFGASRSE